MVTTRFAYDGGNVWADMDGSNTLQTRYLHGDNADQILARVSSSGVAAWFNVDRQGSLRNVSDNVTGGVLDTITYDGFGNILSESNAANGGVYKYAGYRFDTETGLYRPDASARYYDPLTGRWTGQDPIGFMAGDGNLQRYVGNNPTNGTDPSGLAQAPPPPPDAPQTSTPPLLSVTGTPRLFTPFEIKNLVPTLPNFIKFSSSSTAGVRILSIKGDPEYVSLKPGGADQAKKALQKSIIAAKDLIRALKSNGLDVGVQARSQVGPDKSFCMIPIPIIPPMSFKLTVKIPIPWPSNDPVAIVFVPVEMEIYFAASYSIHLDPYSLTGGKQ